MVCICTWCTCRWDSTWRSYVISIHDHITLIIVSRPWTRIGIDPPSPQSTARNPSLIVNRICVCKAPAIITFGTRGAYTAIPKCSGCACDGKGSIGKSQYKQEYEKTQKTQCFSQLSFSFLMYSRRNYASTASKKRPKVSKSIYKK